MQTRLCVEEHDQDRRASDHSGERWRWVCRDIHRIRNLLRPHVDASAWPYLMIMVVPVCPRLLVNERTLLCVPRMCSPDYLGFPSASVPTGTLQRARAT